MIKKFLSLVALSATLITPVFADGFGGLGYYESEQPLQIIQIQQPTTLKSNNEYYTSTYSMRSAVRYSDLNSIRTGVAGAISTLILSVGDEKTWDRAVDEFRTRAEMGYNLSSDAVRRIIDKIEQYKDNDKRAEEEALAILDEEIDKLKSEIEFNSSGVGGSSVSGSIPPNNDNRNDNNRKKLNLTIKIIRKQNKQLVIMDISLQKTLNSTQRVKRFMRKEIPKSQEI